jgi:hypothetical protein
VDQLATLQTSLLKSLLGLVAVLAWRCWERALQERDDRQARANEEEWPSLRRTLRIIPLKLQVVRDEPRSLAPVDSSVVAVLVSRPEMEWRIRRALVGRCAVRAASTWAELQYVVARSAPSAIIVDPAADADGGAERHLNQLSATARMPIVLYTVLTPQTAGMLLALGRLGIRDLILYRYDDKPERFVSICDRADRGDSAPPPLRAA